MKILLASMDNSNIYRRGGKHIHQILLQKGLEEQGHTVVAIFPPKRPFVTRAFQKSLLVVKMESLFQHFSLFIHHSIHSIESQVLLNTRDEDFDAISAQDPAAALAASNVLRKTGRSIPIFLTLHGYFSRELVNYHHFCPRDRDLAYNFCMNIEREAIRQVKGVIAVDSRIKDYVVQELKFCESRCQVHYNAIDNIRFHPVSTEEARALKRDVFRIGHDQSVVLVARRLVKKNGVIYGTRAMKYLQDKGVCDFSMFVAGSGPEEREIKNECKRLNTQGKIHFLGEVSHDNIDRFYKAADIILLPSIRSDNIEEASSLSMLEGMVCGKIVIASAIGGMKEIVHDRENGLLVQEKDPKSISDAIEWTVSNRSLSEKIRVRAHEFAMANHGYREHAVRFLDLIAHV